METILRVVTVAGCVAVLAGWLRIRPLARDTTLVPAWWWGLAASTLGLATASVGLLRNDGVTDQLWYATAVLALCPFIAVLGARRPVSTAWTSFVMLPLVLVLEWPALGSLARSLVGLAPAVSPTDLLELSRPAVIVWAIVLIMGTGNYFGTRLSGLILLLVFGLFLVVLPLAGPRDGQMPQLTWARAIAAVSAAVCVCWSSIELRRRRGDPGDPQPVGWDRVWADFGDLYGTVWATRVRQRLNEELARVPGGPKLEPGGFDWPAGEARELPEGAERVVRWLLERFVDRAWIDRRLSEGTVD